MKKLLMMVFASVLFSHLASAQVINIPDKSKQHFAKKYPKAEGADWYNNVTSYLVKFRMNGNDCRGHYHMDGTWDYTVSYISEEKLPKAVKTSLSKSRIGSWEPKSCAMVDNNKGEHLYRVERKKGVEEMFIFFDKSGKEVKSTYKI
jgi:hypothetical protein